MATTAIEIANARTLRDLEFERVKAQVRALAASPLGRRAVDALQPRRDPEAIERELTRVEEMKRALAEAGAALHPGPLDDLEPVLQRTRESSALGGEEFLTVLKTLESARRWRQRILELEGDYPQLKALAERIGVFRELEGAIRRTFDPEGEVREDASPALRALYARKRQLEAQIEQELKRLLYHPDYAPLVREPIVTRRSGRLVIPIKSAHKQELDCVVHDASDSGRTLYVEPQSVVELNNELRELEGEIRDEKLRILRALTERLRRESRAIRETLKALQTLDGLYARARYALEHRCVKPKLNARGVIKLRGARHPLLDPETVVPIDVEFGDRHQGIVITGPNTGGKTVTLKTIGLLTLMAQAGFLIPAEPETELSVFEVIRSDIGDEQSIEQSLSTFSSHLTTIVGMLPVLSERTLVLIDELGAGTDPEEGAALGIALLRYLLGTGARLAITTHFSPLKRFAYRHERLKTYSVEFDVETLRPTYRLLEGVGASHALVIARRLGLPPEVVEDAKRFLSEGAVKTEEVLQQLDAERRALWEERHRLAHARHRLEEERQRYEEKLRKLEQGRAEALRAELRELERRLKEARRALEEALHAARRERAEERLRAQLKALEAAERGVRGAAAALERRPLEGERGRPLWPEELREGLRVRVVPLGQAGVVRAVLDGGKRAEVEVGGLKVHVKPSDLETAPSVPESAPAPAPRSTAGTGYHELALGSPGLELHLRGMTVSEALRELDLYLDKLVLHDIPRAYIVHGKGTGALRRAIHERLRADPRVVRFYPAPPGQGGEGVTVVELE